MRWMTFGVLLLCLCGELRAESPLVEKYLHSGELARGEQVLEKALAAEPKNDEIRLSLGILQVMRGVERLGQSLYEYAPVENNISLLRLPLPKNPDPTPITYTAFRRVLDQFRGDLATAEATLSGITDDEVKLRLRLADVRFDFDGDKKPEVTLSEIIAKLAGRQLRLPADNTDFLVCIDRGDVAWLRAYCHLLMCAVEIHLALDLQQQFDLSIIGFFANPKVKFKRQDPQDRRELEEAWQRIEVKEPARLGRCRQHLLAICDLNRETWRYIRAERDDDYEWLPNPKQKGILGLPITDEMIDSWLLVINECRDLFSGKKFISPALTVFICPTTKHKGGLSLKELLDNPPNEFNWKKIQNEGIDPQYLVQDRSEANLLVFIQFGQVFQNSLAVGYALWFN